MGYTNKTSHYDLPQWIAGDKPSWLGDVNTAMLNIDTAIAGADTSASAAESSAAAANAQVQAQEAKITKNTTDIQALTEQVADVSGVANAALPKNGGTMTGPLTLAGAPTQDLQAATKKYVDDNSGKGALMLTGGTMTGPLTLSGAPTADLMAATKKYVDDRAKAAYFTKTSNVDGFSNAGGVAIGNSLVLGGILSPISNIDANTDVFSCAGNPFGLTANAPTTLSAVFATATSFSQVTVVNAVVVYNGTNTVIKNSAQISATGITFVNATVKVGA
jgi:hypothetical protein